MLIFKWWEIRVRARLNGRTYLAWAAHFIQGHIVESPSLVAQEQAGKKYEGMKCQRSSPKLFSHVGRTKIPWE